MFVAYRTCHFVHRRRDAGRLYALVDEQEKRTLLIVQTSDPFLAGTPPIQLVKRRTQPASSEPIRDDGPALSYC